jgi:dipeptidyl-peptidase III
MKIFKTMLITAGLALSLSSCENKFTYLIDEFADIKIMRYQIPGWETLTLSQKEYIYHLSEASKAGRDILWDQNFKYNLEIRRVLENILNKYDGDRNCDEFAKFTTYAKRVFFSNGIHHHYAEDKIIPECTSDYFSSLMKSTGNEDKIELLIPIIFDPALYPQRKYTGNDKDLLLSSAVNFYEGVTKQEAVDFYNNLSNPSDSTPISYGLNSKLCKKDGIIYENTYKLDGLYSKEISNIISHLEKAMLVAENDIQKDYINKLINYYKSGDLKLWDDYNVAWVQDNTSDIDFVNGFIENYNDPIGIKATWESVVNFKDKEASKRTEIISNNAQWFEDNSPVDNRFKKESVKGVSAKVITITCLGGDCYPTTPIGINLPNSDWIRKDFGSKSVTIGNITDAYDKAALESPKSALAEFAWDEKEIETAKKYGPLTDNLHTDLHECLGHGSGQLLPSTSPNALGEYSSALEEARADLFALYYLADPKLIELGILPNKDAYKAEYASYIRNGIFVQFSRVELGKSNTQAHMQDRKLIAEWCYEKGQKENIIEKKVREGKTYFVINDYPALRTLFGELLAEVQRIKSEGDYQAGKDLVERYAINIDPELHKEVKERYKALQLKPYGGFVNPDIVPVLKGDKIIDYKIEYCDDFLKQMLNYGKI